MFSFALSLDPRGREPMYEQLYRALAEAIRGGAVRCGERLPSKRELCARLGVSRSTVETAYELLRSEGYVDARPRSGFYAAEYLAPAPGGERQAAEDPAHTELPVRDSPLSTSAVDVSVFPYASWAKLCKEVVYNSPELLQRGDPRGEAGLREALARLLSEYRGVRCGAEQVVVGSGMETLTGQLMTLFGREAVYAMEDPGYPALERSLRSRGRELRYVPMDDSGMDADALADSGAKVAYLTPSHQFPLGITMPASRRSRLLRWAAEEDGWIIEDDYDSEFRYGGRPISSMQGMDSRGRVVYVGTFSRSLAPAIRLAYMVLPRELLPRWRDLYGRQQPTVSRYEQTVMARFLDGGYYARYIRRVGSLYARRREALRAALGEIEGLTVSGAEGGIHLLLTLPRYPEAELLSRAAAAGLPMRGLSEFCREAVPRPSTLVAGYGGLPTEELPALIARLKAAWA